jgi:hypothetical protein
LRASRTPGWANESTLPIARSNNIAMGYPPPLPSRSRCRSCRSRPSPRLPILSGNLAGDLDGTLIRNMLAGAEGMANA